MEIYAFLVLLLLVLLVWISLVSMLLRWMLLHYVLRAAIHLYAAVYLGCKGCCECCCLECCNWFWCCCRGCCIVLVLLLWVSWLRVLLLMLLLCMHGCCMCCWRVLLLSTFWVISICKGFSLPRNGKVSRDLVHVLPQYAPKSTYAHLYPYTGYSEGNFFIQRYRSWLSILCTVYG